MEEAKKMSSWPTSFRRKKVLGLRGRRRLGETIIQALLFFSGFVSIFITLGIVYELGKEALLFFQMPEVSILESLTTTAWQPHTGNFGIWPLVTSTLMTTLIAMSIAIPLGMAVAIYLSEYATPKAQKYSQADSGSAGWSSHHRLWIFRPYVHDSASAFDFRQGCGRDLQHRLRRTRDGNPDPAPHHLDDGGRSQRGAAFFKGSRLWHGRDPARGRIADHRSRRRYPALPRRSSSASPARLVKQ